MHCSCTTELDRCCQFHNTARDPRISWTGEDPGNRRADVRNRQQPSFCPSSLQFIRTVNMSLQKFWQHSRSIISRKCTSTRPIYSNRGIKGYTLEYSDPLYDTCTSTVPVLHPWLFFNTHRHRQNHKSSNAVLLFGLNK